MKEPRTFHDPDETKSGMIHRIANRIYANWNYLAEALGFVVSIFVSLYIIEYYKVTVGLSFNESFIIGCVACTLMIAGVYLMLYSRETKMQVRVK